MFLGQHMAAIAPNPATQVLMNDDLVRIILNSIKHEFRGTRHLTSCARVCRTFHGPAASMIWSDLKTTVPLCTYYPLSVTLSPVI